MTGKNIKPSNSQPVFGLDISDGSLELVTVIKDKDNFIIKDFVRVILPEHIIVHGLVHNEKKLANTIRHIFSAIKIGPHDLAVASALPDSQIIIKTIPIAQKHPSVYDMDEMAKQSLQTLNISINKPVIRWQYRALDNKSGQITLYITQASFIKQWRNFFAKINVNLTFLGMESQMIARAVIQRFHKNENVAILDLGQRTSSLAVYTGDLMSYSGTVDIGGFHITKALADVLRKSTAEAEKIKQLSGIDKNASPDAKQAIINELTQLIVGLDLQKTLNHYNISQVIMTGGGANMPGLSKYLAQQMGPKFDLGKTWISSHKQKNINISGQDIPPAEQALFAGATGLAMIGSDPDNQRKNVNFIE